MSFHGRVYQPNEWLHIAYDCLILCFASHLIHPVSMGVSPMLLIDRSNPAPCGYSMIMVLIPLCNGFMQAQYYIMT